MLSCSKWFQGKNVIRAVNCVSIRVWNVQRKNIGCGPRDLKGRFDKENIATVPNILSFGRILTSPVLGYLVMSNSYPAAFGLFTVAGLSDVLDGYIARKYKGQSSILGSVLDPLADKCMISILCVTLTLVKLIPFPLALVILGRDALLILGSFYIRYVTLPPPVTWSRYWNIQRSTLQVTPTLLGKLNTFLQIGLFGLTLAAPILDMEGNSALQILWYVTGATTIGSGVQYLHQTRGFKILHKKHPKS